MAAGSPRPPSVDRVIAAAGSLLGERDHDAVVRIARQVVEDERVRLAAGEQTRAVDFLAEDLRVRLIALEGGVPGSPDAGGGLTSVLNATGVILHTNLGRAPWPRQAIEAAARASAGYAFLELDRASGRRGRRFRLVEDHLIALTGAEDAFVANNNAAALALAVGLAGRKGVVVGRGELVEIGGGVRIPEIVRRAGARLIEVGTTNRTRASDFEAPLVEGRAAVVLRVHPSNFRLSGFTESPDPVELASIAHGHGALVVDDLGSGALLPTERYGLIHEPLPGERLAAGADLVTFSGDKLLGGPQAGLIVGRADLVLRLRRDPLARAVRPDKATLAALAATLGLYRAGRAVAEVPVWQMIAAHPDRLRERADGLAGALDDPRLVVAAMDSTVGGGSLPGETLPSWGVAVSGGAPDRLVRALRIGSPAVIARVDDDRVLLDLRTIPPVADGELATAVKAALSGLR